MNTMQTNVCPKCGEPKTECHRRPGEKAWFSCLPCNDKEHATREEARKAEELAQKRHRLLRGWIDLVPAAYRLRGREQGLTDPDALQGNVGFAQALLWAGRTNLILTGPTGAQKSRTAFRLLHRAHMDGKSVLWFSAMDFQSLYQTASGKFITDQWLEDVSSCAVVLFDDLLKAKWTENTWGAFFEVIKARVESGLPGIFTLNDGPDEIRRALGASGSPVTESMIAPLIRRMTESATILRMDPPRQLTIPDIDPGAELPRATQRAKSALGEGRKVCW